MKRFLTLTACATLVYVACAAPKPVGIGWTASPDPRAVGYNVYVLTTNGWQQFTNIGLVTSYTFPYDAITCTTNVALSTRDALGNESQFAPIVGSTTVSNLNIIVVIPPGQLKQL